MKEHHVEAERVNARETLRMLRIDPARDFFTLDSTQVESLVAEADRVRYRKPKNANGSRARYFHALLQRRANRKV